LQSVTILSENPLSFSSVIRKRESDSIEQPQLADVGRRSAGIVTPTFSHLSSGCSGAYVEDSTMRSSPFARFLLSLRSQIDSSGPRVRGPLTSLE